MRQPNLVDQQTRRQPSLLTAQLIEPMALGTSATVIYTAKADADFWVKHLFAANATGGAVTYTLYFVPSGDTAATANTVIFQRSLAANTSEVIGIAVNHRLPEGASIQALASAGASINIGGWGYDQRGEP